MPLGDMIARVEVMDWPSGSHASTFGGNPVACAAALETLRLVESRYRANAARRGRELHQALAALASHHRHVREVRGLGLMIGVEIQSGAARDCRSGCSGVRMEAVAGDRGARR